jgi:serine/threonine-protein kinase
MADRVHRRGSRLGKYRLERRIGSGAFASVWKARDTIEGRFVALKVSDPRHVATFGRDELAKEARIAAAIDHPNVARLYNADWVDGHFVMASELARRNLAEYAGARRSAAIGLDIIRQLAAGLAHAHAQGILHRDLKPENILIFEDRRAAIADFGTARYAHGKAGTMTEVGTIGYMAPEQAFAVPRFASDVFALGLIAYETLTGELPKWPFDWPPPRGHKRFLAKVPEPIRPVLRRAIYRNAESRYADAVAFHRALERAFAQSVASSQRRKAPRRRRAEPSPSPLLVQAEHFRKRHGNKLGMRFQCHRCEGPIAESMSHCPWCGTADNSFREISRYPLVCPDCERGVEPEWKACPWCYSGRLQGNGRRPRKDPRAERHCTRPGCEGQLQRFMRYCPMCNQKPRRVWSDPELPHRCPRCRGPVSHTYWRFCPWCGRKESRAGTA